MTTPAVAAALLLSACGAAAFAPPVPAGIRHSFAPRLAAHEPHLAAYESLFSGLAASPGFRKAWTRAPMLYDSPIAGVAGSWTLADVSAACTAGELAQVRVAVAAAAARLPRPQSAAYRYSYAHRRRRCCCCCYYYYYYYSPFSYN